MNEFKGEQLIFRREIDENWMEGSNQIGTIGIFPSSYVRVEKADEPMQSVSNLDDIFSGCAPARPKTPKIEGPAAVPIPIPVPVPVSVENPAYNQYSDPMRNVRFESPPKQPPIQVPIQIQQQPVYSSANHSREEEIITRKDE